MRPGLGAGFYRRAVAPYFYKGDENDRDTMRAERRTRADGPPRVYPPRYQRKVNVTEELKWMRSRGRGVEGNGEEERHPVAA